MKHDLQIIELVGIVGERTGKIEGERQTLELNIVRGGNGKPIFDLRWWSDTRACYGLQLTERSLAELAELIEYYFKENYDQKKVIHSKVSR